VSVKVSIRTIGKLLENKVPVISRQKLIINKRATGRDKDLLDARRLENQLNHN